jgi:hypothetical protein
MILFAAILLAVGFGMLWLGRYLFRGLRFMAGLLFDWVRRLARRARGTVARESREKPRMSQVQFAGRGK